MTKAKIERAKDLHLELQIKLHERKIQMYRNKIDKELDILVDLERKVKERELENGN